MDRGVPGTDIHATVLDSTKCPGLLLTPATTVIAAIKAAMTLRMAIPEDNRSPSLGPMIPLIMAPMSGMSGINHNMVDIVIFTLSIR
jgi:hypothetical protein